MRQVFSASCLSRVSEWERGVMTSYAVKAAEAGLDPTRLKRAFGLLASWADSERVAGSAIAVCRNGVSLPARGLGKST